MKGKRIGATLAVVFLVLGLSLSLQAEEVYEEWVLRFEGVLYVGDLSLDYSGDIVLGGTIRRQATFSDFAIIKVSPSGQVRWVKYLDFDSSFDGLSALSIDKSNNIYATGKTLGKSYDYVTIKFSEVGDILWSKQYQHPYTISDDIPSDIVIDDNNNVFVTGTSWHDFYTVKYSPDGDTLWSARYDRQPGSNDQAKKLVLDKNGDIIVIGSSALSAYRDDYVTVKYDMDGHVKWVSFYNGRSDSADVPNDVALDDSGNIYLTGRSYGVGSDYDYATVKFNSDGDSLWCSRYDGTMNYLDEAYSIGIGENGDVYLTGRSWNTSALEDIVTIRYASDGTSRWIETYNRSSTSMDQAKFLSIDDSGDVYITGRCLSLDFKSFYDILTIKYSKEGERLWIRLYNGTGDSTDIPTCQEIDSSGNIYVAGYSYVEGLGSPAILIKYSPCTSSSPKAGDASLDDSLSVADVISTLNYIFNRGPILVKIPPCDSNLFDCWVYNQHCRYDWNGDKKVTLGDCVRAINYLFARPGEWTPVPSLGCCPFPQN